MNYETRMDVDGHQPAGMTDGHLAGEPSEAEKSARKKRMIFIVLGVLLAILIAGAAYNFLTAEEEVEAP